MPHGRIPTKNRCKTEASGADEHTGDWPGDSHPKLGLRIGSFFFDLSDTTQSKQRDGLYRKPAQSGDRRMRELMQDDGGEEKDRRKDRYCPDYISAPLRIGCLKLSGQ